MNWSNVRLILAREMRDQLRDRRTLFMIFVLPLLLYPLLGTSFFQIAQFMREHPTRVLVLGAAELEGLSQLPPLVNGNRFHAQLFDDERLADLIELHGLRLGPRRDAPRRDGRRESALVGDQTWPESRSLERAIQLVEAGTFHVLVFFPPGFGRELDRLRETLRVNPAREEVPGQRDASTPTASPGSPRVYHNSASEKSQIACARVSRVLDRWKDAVVQQYFKEFRYPPQAANPFQYHLQDVAQRGHRDAALWSKVLPFVLLIWALTGAFYPAVDLCAGEKERGTLETLLSSPAERGEIVWGKLLTIMSFSIATSALNLLSMGVTGTFIIDQLNRLPTGADAAPLSPPPASAALWLLVALVPVAALFSALCLALAAFARSTKEGQYYLMPLVLITMPLMILPMAPGVDLTVGNSLIPVTGVVLLLRALLEGNMMQALLYAPLVVSVTLACCLLAIRWAVDQFNKETVLFRESERLDLRLWMRHLVRDRGTTPTAGEAFSCFVLIMLVQFFMNLALPQLRMDVFADLAVRIFVSLVVMIALPALLMTILFTRSPAATLLLDKRPSLLSVAAALLLAAVLHPVVHTLQFLVQTLYPVSDAVAAHARLFASVLELAPYAWLPLVLLAVLPALCEELAFRGFILSGLRHLGHKWWAIVLSAVFFGVAHGILQQSILATLLGVVLGYLAVQSGSLFPGIVFHMTHNGLLLLSARMHIAPDTIGRWPLLNLLVKPLEGGEPGYIYAWPGVVVGVTAAVGILAWFRRLPYQKSKEEQLQEAIEYQNVRLAPDARPVADEHAI
jgi:sodium transport system permease protein